MVAGGCADRMGRRASHRTRYTAADDPADSWPLRISSVGGGRRHRPVPRICWEDAGAGNEVPRTNRTALSPGGEPEGGRQGIVKLTDCRDTKTPCRVFIHRFDTYTLSLYQCELPQLDDTWPSTLAEDSKHEFQQRPQQPYAHQPHDGDSESCQELHSKSVAELSRGRARKPS